MEIGGIPIVVLAGGEGSRIGGGKPLRTLAGETLIARAVRIARTWSDRVAVAVRADGQVGAIDAVLLRDDPQVAGPLAGLASALRFARDRERLTVLTIACDSPFLPDDLPGRLARGIGGANAAVAASGGEIHPVSALWRTAALDLLPDYLAGGRRSLRSFAEAVGHVAVDWPAEPLDPFFNVNSAEDLARAEAMLRRG